MPGFPSHHPRAQNPRCNTQYPEMDSSFMRKHVTHTTSHRHSWLFCPSPAHGKIIKSSKWAWGEAMKQNACLKQKRLRDLRRPKILRSKRVKNVNKSTKSKPLANLLKIVVKLWVEFLDKSHSFFHGQERGGIFYRAMAKLISRQTLSKYTCQRSTLGGVQSILWQSIMQTCYHHSEKWPQQLSSPKFLNLPTWISGKILVGLQ